MHVIITCKYKKEWMKTVGQTLSIHSQDIEQKPISDINQGPKLLCKFAKNDTLQ